MEFRLLAAALLAVAALVAILRLEARRGDPRLDRRRLVDAALTAAVSGLVAGRLWAMIAGGTNPLARPGDVLTVRGGVDPVVATVAAVAALVVMFRSHLGPAVDALGPAALGALAAWHAGCLVRSACLGTPSDLPWAIARAGSPITRHPVELYAAALLIAGAAFLLVWRRRPLPPAVVGATALTIAAVSRLATEPLRPTLGSGRVLWYLAGTMLGSLLLAGRLVVWRRRGGS